MCVREERINFLFFVVSHIYSVFSFCGGSAMRFVCFCLLVENFFGEFANIFLEYFSDHFWGNMFLLYFALFSFQHMYEYEAGFVWVKERNLFKYHQQYDGKRLSSFFSNFIQLSYVFQWNKSMITHLNILPNTNLSCLVLLCNNKYNNYNL